MDPSDEEALWIQKSRLGDPEAFAALVTRYQRRIYALIQRMVQSPTDAEDLAQEVFIQAYQRLGQYRNEARFTTWLYRIAINRCLNWRQRQHRLEAAFEQWSREQDLTSQGGHVAEENELNQQVRGAIARLHPKQRAAIVLTLYENLNHAEAAKVLGCSETTISWRVFAARRKLKRWLKPLFAPTAAAPQKHPVERIEILL